MLLKPFKPHKFMSHFYAGGREGNFPEATQKPGSSNREFPSLRFSEPESFHPATRVSPHSEYKYRVPLNATGLAPNFSVFFNV
jgi:hypothetical protein